MQIFRDVNCVWTEIFPGCIYVIDMDGFKIKLISDSKSIEFMSYKERYNKFDKFVKAMQLSKDQLVSSYKSECVRILSIRNNQIVH